MSTNNYTATILVDQSPDQVFNAINHVRGWWSGEIDGATDTMGAEFTYTVPGVHFSKQKITELVPGNKIVWKVVEANLGFVKNKSEWKDTSISFDISRKGDKTQIRFTHVGLAPGYECYQDCSNAWGFLINGKLKNMITSGEHQPSPW